MDSNFLLFGDREAVKSALDAVEAELVDVAGDVEVVEANVLDHLVAVHAVEVNAPLHGTLHEVVVQLGVLLDELDELGLAHEVDVAQVGLFG